MINVIGILLSIIIISGFGALVTSVQGLWLKLRSSRSTFERSEKVRREEESGDGED